MVKDTDEVIKQEIESEREEILKMLEDWLEIPMIVLSFIWLALFIVEMIYGLSPFLETVGIVIWVLFGIEYVIKFAVANDKSKFVLANWVSLVALLLPALRVFRAARAFRLLRFARTARGLRLVRLLTTLNRGMKALGASFAKRGFGYVLTLTLIVLFGGAAAMYGFEKDIGGGIQTYSDAVWWTAMILTTMGSDYFPKTGEGRMLCVLLALYGFAVFGYVTATLATFFIHQDRDIESKKSSSLEDMRAEMEQMRILLAQRLPH